MLPVSKKDKKTSWNSYHKKLLKTVYNKKCQYWTFRSLSKELEIMCNTLRKNLASLEFN